MDERQELLKKIYSIKFGEANDENVDRLYDTWKDCEFSNVWS